MRCSELNNIGEGAKVQVSDIEGWFKMVDSLKSLATAFGDEAGLEELEEQIERMNWVYKAMTGNQSPLVIKGECFSTFGSLTQMRIDGAPHI